MAGAEQEREKKIVLVGGGHAHLFVLKALIEGRLMAPQIVLISASRTHYYSGMLPGVVAGHYQVERCSVDLRKLAERAGIRFIEERVVALDAGERSIRLASGKQLSYDLISLDTGSETDTRDFAQYEGTQLSVKPLDEFYAKWCGFSENAKALGEARLAVVGAGAAGVELAMAAAHSLRQSGVRFRVNLIASERGVLPEFSTWVRSRVTRALKRQQVAVLRGPVEGCGRALCFADGESLRVDAVILAAGARAPSWLTSSGLALDPKGFVIVDQYHRSCSHPDLFAVGDIAARPGTPLMRSGVHSVRAGPILARNLAAVLGGKALEPFHPRSTVLYLIACGGKQAVASWGSVALSGRWAWRWKDRIDRRFIARFELRSKERWDHRQ